MLLDIAEVNFGDLTYFNVSETVMSYTRMAQDIPEVQHKDDETHWSTKITVKGWKEHHGWGDMFAVLVGN